MYHNLKFQLRYHQAFEIIKKLQDSEITSLNEAVLIWERFLQHASFVVDRLYFHNKRSQNPRSHQNPT